MSLSRNPRVWNAARRHSGFSLIELMISLVIGLVILASLVSVFVNTSGGNREMARANQIIENGRLAIELLESDVVHAGYWDGYIPQFDDQTLDDGTAPTDAPTAIPDPCQDWQTDPWTADDRNNMISIAIQVYDSDTECAGIVLDKQADTDVLIVRHAELCVAGSGGDCEDDIAENLYFQTARCTGEAGNYVLDTAAGSAFPLHALDCTTPMDKRKFVSNLYYVRDYAVTAGDGIPTLMRSVFDYDGSADIGQQPAVAMVEGIEGFHIELGVDNRSRAYTGNPTGTPVDYTAAVNWYDPTTRTTPTNRGDGSPDGAFASCTTATPCTLAQFENVTAVKIYVLVRSREASPGYNDTKTYQLGSVAMGPFNDGFKRHVYVSTVRLPNIAGRRQSP
jgi:type IV pilus assembly protein PilW